jgi:chemotaxis protein MotC
MDVIDFRAISSEVEPTSRFDLDVSSDRHHFDLDVSIDRHRYKVATKQQCSAGFRFNWIGSRSSPGPTPGGARADILLDRTPACSSWVCRSWRREQANDRPATASAGGLCMIVVAVLMQLAMISVCRAEAPSQDRPRAARGSGVAQPFELVRALEALQDQVVLGKADARAKLTKLLGQIGTGILVAEPKAWDDPRNLRAVIVYAASGGKPGVVRAVAELGVARGEAKDLLDGILAYVEGRDAHAKQALLAIDATTLPAPLAGHVALVQANLTAREDPRKAMRLLAVARVLAPGTLVEEAALRKQIFLADQGDDIDSFASLSSQYMRRFDRSVYAENFRQRFRDAVMRFGLTSDPARFAKLQTVLGVLEPEAQLQLLLATARGGLLDGKVEPARLVADAAVGLAGKATVEASRAALYAAAIRILAGEIDAGLAALQTVETSRLGKPDAGLAMAVRAIASDIRAEPSEPRLAGAEPEPASNAPLEGPAPRASVSAAALIERAEAALAEISTLLERKPL